MAFRHLWLIPVLSTGFALAAFIAGYAIAVGDGVEKAWFSYISDGGAHPPESCVFGQLLNIGALFTAITVYLRHRQYVVYYKYRFRVYNGWWRTCSLILLWIGFILSFGVSMVANFQETSVAFCHFLGAMMAFFGGVIYIWGQIMLSYAIVPTMTPLWLNHLRVAMNALATGALALHMVCEWGKPFVKDVNGVKPTDPPKFDGITKLDPSSPYYTNHIVTTVAEWTLAIALELVMLTFAWELRNFESHLPRLYFKNELYPAPIEGNRIGPRTSVLNDGFPFKENASSSTISTTIPRPKFQDEGVYERRVDPEERRNEYVY